jgi:hypothetical protein
VPYATSSLATLRPDLAQSLMEFDLAMDRAGFIGLRVLPVIEVAMASGNFGRIPKEALLQAPETSRAPGGAYGRGKFKFTPDSYATQEHGWEEPVDDNEATMYRLYFDAETISAQRAMDVVLRAQETRAANMLFDTTTWTGSSYYTAVGTAWTPANHTTATPIADVMAARLKVWQNCGMWPNAVVMNRLVFNNLRQLDDIKENIRYSASGNSNRGAGTVLAREITPQLLAAVFDVDEVIVAGSAQNSANEGQSASFSQIWSSSYCAVARICRSNDVREPGVGRTFHWGADGSEIGGTIETYRDESIRSDVVRVRNQTQEKLLYKDAQYLLGNVS